MIGVGETKVLPKPATAPCRVDEQADVFSYYFFSARRAGAAVEGS
jgi:hypothetical protein